MSFKIPVHENKSFHTDIPEKEYCKKTTLEYRKKYAQFFTPYPIAKFMVHWILQNKDCKNILDPAFGLGIFARALLEIDPKICIKGYDIDSDMIVKASKIMEGHKVMLHNKDYIYNDWGNKYSGIICNPPYQKFHDYDNKPALKEVEEKLSCSLSGFTNLYTLFLIKSVHQLKEGGRAAYIVPSEFMNSDYGTNIKSFIKQTGALRYVIVFDFEENVFDGALTTSSILLFSNDNRTEASVEFIVIKSADELAALKYKLKDYPSSIGKQVYFSDLKPQVKWRSYYQDLNSVKYKNIVPFTTYGKVVRGIATGANSYFAFNIDKQKKHEIGDKFLLPCITKANQVSGPFFTQNHYQALKKGGKNIFLLNARDTADKNVKRYIELGEANNIHKKYLTSHRNPWYILENRPPAPIWVSVFNRKGLRFIRNEAGISNLTTFHCIYLNMFSSNRADLFFAYLLTDISKRIFNDNRREYGNGLKKFEPNDLNLSHVVDLDKIDSNEELEIIKTFDEYREGVLNTSEDTKLLGKLNELFLSVLMK